MRPSVFLLRTLAVALFVYAAGQVAVRALMYYTPVWHEVTLTMLGQFVLVCIATFVSGTAAALIPALIAKRLSQQPVRA